MVLLPAAFTAIALVATTSLSVLAAPSPSVQWSYDGAFGTGPERWGDLNPDYKACDKGKTQSPVDFASMADLRVPSTFTGQINMAPLTLTQAKNKGHTIEFTPKDNVNRTLTVDGTVYSLAQFHVHTPSEHRIDRRYFAGELHFVHSTADGKRAVFGVLLNATLEDNPKFATLLSSLPGAPTALDEAAAAGMVPDESKDAEEAATTSTISGTVLDTNQLVKLVTEGRGYYTYIGSLTVPPCTENVRWIVAAESLQLSWAQIEKISQLIGFTARPTQYNEDVLRRRSIDPATTRGVHDITITSSTTVTGTTKSSASTQAQSTVVTLLAVMISMALATLI